MPTCSIRYCTRAAYSQVYSSKSSCYPVIPRVCSARLRPSAAYSTMAEATPTAEYRQLGKSGLRVSVPILGAMSIGDPRWMDWVIGENEVSRITSYALTFHLKETIQGPASTESCLRSWAQLLGHGQCLQQWRIREDHW